MTIRPLDTLMAMKVIGLLPNLNANDRRVAAVLLDHFNRRTGRCDPGLERIAALLGISERTVIRSNARLERTGLFRKIRHGGYGNRNSYEPMWSRFKEYENSWQTKMKTRSSSRRLPLSPQTGQGCHIEGDSAVTQTCSTKPFELTCSRGLPKKEAVRSDTRAASWPTVKRSADAARDEAERRWATQLNEQYRSHPVTYAEIIQAITDEIRDAATRAELRLPGSGFRYIAQRIQLGKICKGHECRDET